VSEQDKVYHDQIVRIVELVDGMAIPVLSEMTFQRCQIVGPAVILPLGNTQFLNSRMDHPDEMLWETQPNRVYVGAIGVDNCVFDDCDFNGIGIAGPPDYVRTFRNAMLGP
jgi:hypothetical protein